MHVMLFTCPASNVKDTLPYAWQQDMLCQAAGIVCWAMQCGMTNAVQLLLTCCCPCPCTADLPALIDMVSAGTLMVFAVVAVALIWKRIVRNGVPASQNALPLALIFLLVGACIGEKCSV
jgi:hypothetical protein